MELIMTSDRQQLISRLEAAEGRSKVNHYVYQTIRLALQDHQISPATALGWLREEGLADGLDKTKGN
jgi:hypothetical protein